MSIKEEVMTACDWCLQEAPVQTIDDHLWRFWKIISAEDPIMSFYRNICDKCSSRYEGFSIYIERCKINTSKVDELLSTGQVKDEPSIDIEYHPLIKKEILDEVDSNLYHPAVSSGVDQLLNDEDIRKERASDPDYLTASGGKGKTRLVLHGQVLPDSIVLQKKVNNTLMCTYCGKTFNFPSKLKIHLRTHSGEKPYKCSRCNRSFAYTGDLICHLRTHTGEKPFKCPHCNKGFVGSNGLNLHLRTHTGEKRYKCLHCSKSFARSDKLNSHLRTHTGEKPFKCSHCNRSFAQSSHLNNHLLTHTGEKSYKCSHCNKRFAQSSHLNIHLRTHTGEKAYKCSHCNRSFAQSTNLNSHLRCHTHEKPFECPHCDKTFARSSNLNIHLGLRTIIK